MGTQMLGGFRVGAWTRRAGCALLLALSVTRPWAADQSALVAIPISGVAAHVGETVTVEGRVADVFTSKKGNTFLNFGAPYPNQTFSAVIFVSEASLFPGVHSLEGRTVRVTGRVILYEGKPEIILKNPKQLKAAL